jgi:hypothetical protein
MTDTSPEVALLVREKIMARPGAERFVMGALMFDAARTMMLASFPPDLSEPEQRRRLFARLYSDLPASEIPPMLRAS